MESIANNIFFLQILDPRNLRVNNKKEKPKCDDQCIGGCSGPSHLDCYACKNVMDEMSNGRKNCRINCPDGLLLVSFKKHFSQLAEEENESIFSHHKKEH